jgi:hypothetical protein
MVQHQVSTHILDVGEYVHPTGQLPLGDGNARHRVPAVGAQKPEVGDDV